MQRLQPSLQRLGTILFFFFSYGCFAQGRTLVMNDSTGFRSYSVLAGDTVLIRFDSAFVLNKATFKLYQETYNKAKKGDPNVKRLLENYESLVSLQDSMLQSKEVYYQQLKMSFDSLATGSKDFLDKTDVNISAINQSLANANRQLNSIQSLLDSSLEKLKQESRLRFKTAIKGFAVGIGVASLIFLLTK